MTDYNYKPQLYDRHSVVPIEPVLEAIRAIHCLPSNSFAERKLQQSAVFNGIKVKLASLRLQTFAARTENKGIVCSCCGLEADHFAIERDLGQMKINGSYHLNLYAGNTLFTHDHTLARSLGGKDNISNTTTMCSPCNGKKALIEQDILLRKINATTASEV